MRVDTSTKVSVFMEAPFTEAKLEERSKCQFPGEMTDKMHTHTKGYSTT